MSKINKNSRGFTLIELIIVIVLTAILAVGVSSFIKVAINAYDNTSKRAVLVDEAHTIIKKIQRDTQTSLPNSIRITSVGNKTYLEMMLVDFAGKYRSSLSSTGTGDPLDFNTADSSFDVVSGSYIFSGGEKIVVGNLGTLGFDAYAGDTSSNYTGATGVALTNIKISPKMYPYAADRFYVVTQTITYVCDKTAQTLTRYSGYAPTALQPTNDLISPLASAAKGLLGKILSDCRITYAQGQNSRNSVLSVFIKVNKGNEFINMYADTNVPNS